MAVIYLMPIFICGSAILDFVLDPFCVLIDKLQNFLAKFFFALAVTFHSVDPVHVEEFVGDVTFKVASCMCLKIDSTC
jgi:hypothetical protein